MVLNLECIRDILFEIEKHSAYGEFYEYNPANLPTDSFLTNYDLDVILYHVRQCDLSGYLLNVNWKAFEYVGIEDLTPEGHAFIANIKNEEKWSKTKSIISKAGGASLKLVTATAEGVTNAFLQKYTAEISHFL